MKIEIREATLNDAGILFSWANDPLTRENSFNSDPIEWLNHAEWFSSTLKSKKEKIYVLQNENDLMGVVRFQEKGIVGITVAPNYRGKGLGSKLLNIACKNYLKHNPSNLFAYVKKGNLASLKIFQKVGFRLIGEDIINNCDCYVLKTNTLISGFNLNEKTMIIAELSANHGQKIELAIETIKAAKRAGADAIKLQTYTPDTLTIDCDNVSFTSLLKGTIWEGRTLYDLYQEAYTPWEWHKELFHVAREEGLICFSTPFDKSAVDFLEQFNPPSYKIASFEITDIPLIDYTAKKGRPIIISTGIADLKDIELAVKTCQDAGNNNIILLKCTSTYPAPIEEANLLTIPDLKEKFNVEVGVSDHSLGIIVPIVAVTLGARVIEKHFILDKSIGGPDASFSLDIEQFKEMVQAVRETEKAIGKLEYDLTEKMKKSREFSRSLYVVENIKEGGTITEKNVRSIRPGYGLHPKYYKEIIGKKTNRDLYRGDLMKLEYIEK